MAEMIKVLLVEPMKMPRMIEVEHTLESFHDLVGGYLQAVYPWDTNAALVCDDEGKFKGYPPNRALVDENGEPYDIVVGSFFICGISEDNFASLDEGDQPNDSMSPTYANRVRRYLDMLLTLDPMSRSKHIYALLRDSKHTSDMMTLMDTLKDDRYLPLYQEINAKLQAHGWLA